MGFLGNNLVVLPLGTVVNLVVGQCDPEIVADALRTTGLVTVAMMCLGSAVPPGFSRR